VTGAHRVHEAVIDGVTNRPETVVSSPCTPQSQIECANLLVDVFKSDNGGGAATDRTVGTQANVGHTAIRRNDDQPTRPTTLGRGSV
jgi:hypothetical protein